MNSVGQLVLYVCFLLFTVSIGNAEVQQASSLPQLPFSPKDILAETKSGYKLTYEDVLRISGYYPEEVQKNLFQNPDHLFKFVKRLVESHVLAQAAQKENFNKRPDVAEQLLLLENDTLSRLFLQAKLDELKVSDKEVHEFYMAERTKYKDPAKFELYHILFRVPDKAKKEDEEAIKKRAEEALKRIQKGEDFKKVASELSEDTGSKEKGGYLGVMQANVLDPAFKDAVSKLELNKTAGPIRSVYGYHVVKVVSKTPEKILPFETVKDKVKDELLRQKKNAKLNELIDEYLGADGVVIYKNKIGEAFKK